MKIIEIRAITEVVRMEIEIERIALRLVNEVEQDFQETIKGKILDLKSLTRIRMVQVQVEATVVDKELSQEAAMAADKELSLEDIMMIDVAKSR